MGISKPMSPAFLPLLVVFVFVIIYYLYCVGLLPADPYLLSRLQIIVDSVAAGGQSLSVRQTEQNA